MDYQRHRQAKDRFFAIDRRSPLSDEARPGFEGLAYYEPDAAWAMRLPVEPGDGSPLEVGTSDGVARTYTRAGIVKFSMDGTEHTLTLLGTPGRPGYFLPFRDATSGSETYGAGRYLDLEPATDGLVDVDFNLAYHPFCAYDDRYSCPLPPYQNWLEIPVRAGERNPL